MEINYYMVRIQNNQFDIAEQKTWLLSAGVTGICHK